MTLLRSKRVPRTAARSRISIGAPLAVALMLAGCSWVPDWANPMNAYDAVFGDDPPPPTLAGEKDKQLVTRQSGDTFPNVGSVPDQAPQTSSAAERRQIVRGLIADKQNARYTDDSGTGQQVASAPPPPPGAARETSGMAAAAPKPITVPSIVQGGPQPIAAPRPGALRTVMPVTAAPQPRGVVPATPVPQVAVPTASVTLPQQSTPMSPGQLTTVEQVFAARIAQSGATVTNATTHLGFQMPAQPVNSLPLLAQSAAAGGALPPSTAPATQTQLAAIVSGALRPTDQTSGEPVIVYFADGSSRITARALAKVGDIARRYKANGGGVIRVVGHASSRTRNLTIDKHKLVNFSISMDRAQAVARELVRQGVSPGVILVEARSDNEPLFFESMRAAETQNRRAEVYLEF